MSKTRLLVFRPWHRVFMEDVTTYWLRPGRPLEKRGRPWLLNTSLTPTPSTLAEKTCWESLGVSEIREVVGLDCKREHSILLSVLRVTGRPHRLNKYDLKVGSGGMTDLEKLITSKRWCSWSWALEGRILASYRIKQTVGRLKKWILEWEPGALGLFLPLVLWVTLGKSLNLVSVSSTEKCINGTRWPMVPSCCKHHYILKVEWWQT
jgi:hypothetical protein